MIVIEANPARIERVCFTGQTAGERAVEAAVYSAVESIVDQLDQKLRRLSQQVLAGLER